MSIKSTSLFLSISTLPLYLFSQSTFFTGGNICPNSEWKIVFNDEFNGDSLDREKWINYFPYAASGDDQCEFCRTHGNEGQIFTDTNLEVSNGTLKLIARRQTSSWFSASRDYTSALIHSKYDFRYMYGKFEIRCKIPSGKGLNSAFWMFGGTGTEIDAFEIHGEEPNQHGMGVIKWHETEFFARHDCSREGINLSSDFHDFIAEWDPFFVSFLLDGEQVFLTSRFYTITGTQVNWCCVEPGEYNLLPAFPSGENNYVSIIASLGVGAGDDAPNANTPFPSQLEIDYIRVYQRDPPSSTDYNCEVLLFPNPVNSILKIRKNKMTSVLIENIFGEILYSKAVSGDETDADVSLFKQGIYFVEVQSEDGTFANKFIKY